MIIPFKFLGRFVEGLTLLQPVFVNAVYHDGFFIEARHQIPGLLPVVALIDIALHFFLRVLKSVITEMKFDGAQVPTIWKSRVEVLVLCAKDVAEFVEDMASEFFSTFRTLQKHGRLLPVNRFSFGPDLRFAPVGPESNAHIGFVGARSVFIEMNIALMPLFDSLPDCFTLALGASLVDESKRDLGDSVPRIPHCVPSLLQIDNHQAV